MVTHFKLENGRLACRPYALGFNARVTLSTIATKVPEHVTCSRCLNSGRIPKTDATPSTEAPLTMPIKPSQIEYHVGDIVRLRRFKKGSQYRVTGVASHKTRAGTTIYHVVKVANGFPTTVSAADITLVSSTHGPDVLKEIFRF